MKALLIGLGLGLAWTSAAQAQPAALAPISEGGQKLAECVSTKATPEDRAALTKWVGAEIASSALLAGVVTVDADKRVALDKDTARIFTRLVVNDCAEFSKPLFKAEGGTAFRAAGAAISRLAVRELISSPGVNQGIVRSYLANLNQADFAKLLQP